MQTQLTTHALTPNIKFSSLELNLRRNEGVFCKNAAIVCPYRYRYRSRDYQSKIYWRICLLTGNCNQQTRHRKEGRETP